MLEMNSDDVIYQAASLTFDPSLIEIFCTLSTNASLLILPKSIKVISDKLNPLLIKHKVTILQVIIIFKFLCIDVKNKNEPKNN